MIYCYAYSYYYCRDATVGGIPQSALLACWLTPAGQHGLSACFCFYRFVLHISNSKVSGCPGRRESNRAGTCGAFISCSRGNDVTDKRKIASSNLEVFCLFTVYHRVKFESNCPRINQTLMSFFTGGDLLCRKCGNTRCSIFQHLSI